MVVVDIEDGDPFAGGGDDRLGRDRSIVAVAVPAVHRASRVMTGRPAEPVGRRCATEDEIHGGQRHVHRGPRREVRAGDQRRGGIEPPEARASGGMDGLPNERGDRVVGHPLEHRPVRIRVGGEEGAIQSLRPKVGPGDLEESEEPGVMNRGDRVRTMAGRSDRRESAVRLECGADALHALGDFVGRDRETHEGLDRDVVTEVRPRIDDLHGTLALSLPHRRRPRGSPR